MRTGATSEQEIGCISRSEYRPGSLIWSPSLIGSKVGSLADEQPLEDTSGRPPSGRKRARSPRTSMILSSAELPDIPSVAGREDVDKRKRQKTISNMGNPILEPMPSLVTSSGSLSRCGDINERGSPPIDSGSPPINLETPFSPLRNLEEENDVRVNELLRSPRREVTSTGRVGDEAINPVSDTLAAYGTDRGGGRSGEGNHLDGIDGSLQETSPRSNHRGRPSRMKGRSRSQPSHGSARRTSISASTLPSTASTRFHQPPMPRTESALQTCSPQRQSPKSKAGGSHDQMGAKMSYEITDLTHNQVPTGSSVVTMIVRCTESNLPLHPVALHRGLFGSEGELIRMKQLSPESWMLVGHRRDDVALNTCSREDPTSPSITRASISTSDSASDGDSSSDEDETCEEDRFARTRIPWSKSDEERLLSLRDKMLMSWNDVTKRFPERTPGAVKARYYALHNKNL